MPLAQGHTRIITISQTPPVGFTGIQYTDRATAKSFPTFYFATASVQPGASFVLARTGMGRDTKPLS